MGSEKESLININSSDEKLLVSALKISQRLAKRIIAFRPFQSTSQLEQVWGIDPQTLNRILPLVTTGAESSTTVEPTPAPVKVEEETTELSDLSPFELSLAAPRKPKRLPKISNKTDILLNWLLAAILLAAAFFRFTGINWDQNKHQHPDERFISMVAAQIHTVDSVKAYFDTANSTLNPIKYGSYTYGMLPLFLTRAVAEVIHQTNYDQITLVGRVMSGIFDLLALWMIYLLGKLLYNKKTGVLAAGLYAAAVFPIQMSHFFTVDSFCTVFVILAVYLSLKAIRITDPQYRLDWRKLAWFALFGLVVGMAGACKVNALPVFLVILVAALVHLLSIKKQNGFQMQLGILACGLLLAILFTFISFRVFQPYAFSGTGFLGSSLNQRWLDIIKEVTNQVAGFSEWPPNHHWTDRSFSYAWVNMVVWGLGLPLGLAGWAGWGWSAWRMWKGEWRNHLLPFIWVLVYFVWQNAQFWRYMRYFLIIYPFLILFAAWAIMQLLDKTKESRLALSKEGFRFSGLRKTWQGLGAVFLLAVILLYSYAYAFGFSRIYTRPITRIAASEWILDNIQGPLNLKVDTPAGQDSYPIYIINRWTLEPGDTPKIDILASDDGTVKSVTSTDIRQVGVNLYFRISKKENGDEIVTEGRLPVADDDASTNLEIQFGQITLAKDTPYYFRYKVTASSLYSLSGVTLQNEADDNSILKLDWQVTNQSAGTIEGSQQITPSEDIKLNRLKIAQFQQTFQPTSTTLKVSLLKDGDEANPLTSAESTLEFTQPAMSLHPTFDLPQAQISRGGKYQVRYEILSGSPLRLFGEAYALETTWDDSLPLAVRNVDALGGVYNPSYLQLYDADTPDKREKMIDILDNVEYLVIPSNRCYDAMPRLPNRYPMTLKYYQELFACDCMGDQLENWVYQLEPPFKSPLGFDLVATFTSDPSVGPFKLNDQSADESFTVYDHPKVLIFKKNDDFSIDHVKDLLNSVNLDDVLFQSPMSYTKAPNAMVMPSIKLAAQELDGTWSAMFSRISLVNANQTFGAIMWYLLLFALGLLVFPLVFSVFSGLPDRGYPLARMAAILLTAWLAWMFGSLNLLPFTRWTVLLAVLLVGALSVFLGIRNKASLLDFVKKSWKYILITEGLFAAVFVIMLVIRINNPDLWQPWMGGEKPMDFAFFNAVLKSVYFPPENPWFSGHYLNYYYYGYVLAAIPTKLSGIMPSIAYNLILPAWFAMTGIGVFSVAFNLVTGLSHKDPLYKQTPTTSRETTTAIERSVRRWAVFAGIFAMVAVIFMGNFYEVKLLVKHAPEMIPENWTVDHPENPDGGKLAGVWQVLSGKAELPGNNSLWYFEASRPILNGKDDTPIAEFPYFTFLYGDMHPHLLTMPIYALALGWMLSILIHPLQRKKWLERIVGLAAAAVIFGCFSASHTWDFYPFAGLAVLCLIWSTWYAQSRGEDLHPRILTIAIYVVAFVGLAKLFYLPFSYWFKTAYSSIQLWTGAKTPLADYLVVFGLSLFIMLSLLIKESLPGIRAAYKNWPNHSTLYKITVLVILVAIYLVENVLWNAGYQVLTFGALMLIGLVYQIFFRRSQSKLHLITWILFGIGLLLTMMVEVVVLKGDVGRSNMVFRMYNEAWFYFGLAGCLGLTLQLSSLRKWPQGVSIPWVVVLAALLLMSLLYPYLATGERTSDRWPNIVNPPKTLDGEAFMLGESDGSAPAIYDDEGTPLNLAEDYAAIHYMQDNVIGSPVIAEGHRTEYKWGSRFSIHTGLPTIIGWSWHTRQHNSLLDGAWFDKRIEKLNDFYNTTDLDSAKSYIQKYKIEYIIIGDLERAWYADDGLKKFQELVNQGVLQIVFGDATANTTTIYKVITQ